jgi:hypothetical protein
VCHDDPRRPEKVHGHPPIPMTGMDAQAEKILAAAKTLLAREDRGREGERLLAGLLESFYRLTREPQARSAQLQRLSSYAPHSRQIRLWRSLAQLAASHTDEPWRESLSLLDGGLPARDARATVFIHTEAAREVGRLTGDLSAALARLRGRLSPLAPCRRLWSVGRA